MYIVTISHKNKIEKKKTHITEKKTHNNSLQINNHIQKRKIKNTFDRRGRAKLFF